MSEWGVWEWIVILYLVGIIPAMLVVARFVVRHDVKYKKECKSIYPGPYKLDMDTIVLAAGLGICMSIIWPLILPGIWIGQVLKNDYADPPKAEDSSRW